MLSAAAVDAAHGPLPLAVQYADEPIRMGRLPECVSSQQFASHVSRLLHRACSLCRAAADAQRERQTAAVTKEARQLQSRRHGGGGGGSGTSSRQRSYSPEAPEQRGEEGEEEDFDDKLE